MIPKPSDNFAKSIPEFTDAHRRALPSCSRNGSVPDLRRGELAILVGRSTRTINRWESVYGFGAKRQNARVLSYPFETLIGLVALGATLNMAEAERRGLNSKSIIAFALAIAPRPPPQVGTQGIAEVVLIAEDEDDRRLIRMWRDQALGPVLRKIIRGLSG